MKILIIGASGFLGSTIYHKLKSVENIELLGTYITHRNQNEFIQLDVLDTKQLQIVVKEFNPDAIIWTVMNHELEEIIADEVMPVLSEFIGSIRFIFLSTSVAYEKNMTEEVEPFIRTEDWYNHHYFNGKIKSESIIRMFNNFCIIRPGSIYGINPDGKLDSRSRTLKDYVESDKKYIRATNIIFSIVEVNEFAEAVIELLSSEYIGIINISEEEPVSHYNFNKALCQLYGWDDSCIVGKEEEENIYYFNNDLRKKILKTTIGTIKTSARYAD